MGTIKTTNIEPIADNGTVTLGSSGDTFTIPSGVTMVNNGTQSGFGGTNTPAFSAFLTSGQTVTTNTWTKLSLSDEQWDTNNAYDPSTNYRFTVPSGEGGKYLFTYAGGTESLSSSTISQVQIYKNNSAVNSTIARSYPNTTTGGYPHKSIVLDLSVGDYIELYGQHTKGSDSIFDQRYTFLQAQKLIGV